MIRLLTLLALPFFAVLSAAPVARPNIVLIITDDQGYGDSTGFWKTDLETPHLDAIGREGARFTRFRVNPLCAPTRASVMTGLDSLASGMWRGPSEGPRSEERTQAKAKKRAAKSAPRPAGDANADDDPESRIERRLAADLRLLPQFLKAAGYATGAFGKWHLGYEPANSPAARGFDSFTGFIGGAHPYWLRPNSRVVTNGAPVPTGAHTTDLFADRAIEFIRAHRERPFFCYLAFNAVHGPLRNAERDADSARPEWLAYYERKGVPQPRRDYNAVMTHADARIGDVLRTLTELGLAENTLVICHSDNGGILHSYPSYNGPLRGGKGQTYEGGIRVPLMVRGPGVRAGVYSNEPVVGYDLLPTILDLAVPGFSLPAGVEGGSWKSVLTTGGAATVKRLEFGIGTGDWDDTEVMPDAVSVTTTLVLQPKP